MIVFVVASPDWPAEAQRGIWAGLNQAFIASFLDGEDMGVFYSTLADTTADAVSEWFHRMRAGYRPWLFEGARAVSSQAVLNIAMRRATERGERVLVLAFVKTESRELSACCDLARLSGIEVRRWRLGAKREMIEDQAASGGGMKTVARND